MIYKYCQRCGKRLKGEENRLRGYGKTCFEKARQEAQGMTPLITPPREQVQKELKRLKAKEARARAEAEEISKARARLQASQEQTKGQGKRQGKSKQEKSQEARQEKSSQEQGKRARPPHLEKTLTPTYKKPFLFTPHT